jgi:hypothetical protein
MMAIIVKLKAAARMGSYALAPQLVAHRARSSAERTVSPRASVPAAEVVALLVVPPVVLLGVHA